MRPKPHLESCDSLEAYLEDLVEWKIDELLTNSTDRYTRSDDKDGQE